MAPSSRSSLRALKIGVALAATAPGAIVVWRFATGALGANPIAEALNRLGWWALTLLLASLACTPLKIVTGWNWPLRLRRLLGLFAFGYACLHFLTYVGLDQFFDWRVLWQDVVKRKFMTVGFAALLLLVPLAVTSTNRMVKRLGFKRWKRLHRLVYLAACLGVIHFFWRVKSDLREPAVFAAVLTLLLAIRLVAAARGSASPRSSSLPP